MRNLYEVLGIDISNGTDGFTKKDIKQCFRAKASEFHPDRNKDPDATERFQEIQQAWEVLGDDEARAQYDRDGSIGNGEPLPEVSILIQVFTMLLDQHSYADMNYFTKVREAIESELSKRVRMFRNACKVRDKFEVFLTNHKFTGVVLGAMETKRALLANDVSAHKLIETQLLASLELLEKFKYTGSVNEQEQSERDVFFEQLGRMNSTNSNGTF